MPRSTTKTALLFLVACVAGFCHAADQVAVRQKEGLMHGFLSLRSVDGKKLADGETTQTSKGDVITDYLIFRFSDGSVYEDTTEFTQNSRFRLLRDHLIQKGPSFKMPTETWIDAPSGQVTVKYKDKDGKEKELKQKLALPSDLANGLVFTVVKDIDSRTPQTTLSFLAATPKPRVVKLLISPEGKRPLTPGSERKAEVFNMKVKIPGVAGLVAHVAHKVPADTHIWITSGEAPTFVRSEGPLYDGGPVWRIEVVSPPGNR